MKHFIKQLFKNTIGIHYLKYLQESFPSSREKQFREDRSNFYSQFIPEGGCYYDIGANFGNRIEPIIKKNYKIIAIEPQQECINYLKLRFGKKIEIVGKGLGERSTQATMHISSNPVLSSFSEDWIEKTNESGRFKKYKWEETRTIQITTLDDVIMEYGQPDFAKIDVEGYELNVLKGLSQPIKMVSLEYAAPEGIDMIEQCISILNQLATNRIECNYSIGESMNWASDRWYTYKETIALIRSKDFTESGFGDIYIRSL